MEHLSTGGQVLSDQTQQSYTLLSGPPPRLLSPHRPVAIPSSLSSAPSKREPSDVTSWLKTFRSPCRPTAIPPQTFLPVYKQEAGLFTEHSEANIAMCMCISSCSAPETLAGLGSPQNTLRESLDDRTSCRLRSRETFLTTFLVFQSHCLPVLNLAPSSPVLAGHWPLRQYPSCVPINSCSPCRTQLTCYHLCKTSLHHLLSPGRLHVPPFVIQ